MIRSLVFDKDGVILDLVGTWFPVMQALADYTLTLQPDPAASGLTRADLLDAVGVDDASGHINPLGVCAAGSFRDIRAAWQQLLPADMTPLAENEGYQAEMRRLARELVHGNAVPKGDVATPLSRLTSAGFRIALLTNDSEESARHGLEQLGILELFDPVIGADSGHGGKPEPHGLLHCIAAHGATPEEALMIGDTNADFGAARAAGVADFICIADSPDERPHADVSVENVIPRLSDLPDLLVRRGDMKQG